MEVQLEDYVITLKGRNQVIKQVDCEDGSSVAMDDTFTDRDLDERFSNYEEEGEQEEQP